MMQVGSASSVRSAPLRGGVTAEFFPHGRFLMCPPTYYGIKYEINPWMHLANQVQKIPARRQWMNLFNLLVRLGAYTELIDPQDFPDMVFSANAGLVWERTFISSHFRHKERQREEPLWKEWFRSQGYKVISLTKEVAFEGGGDALFAPPDGRTGGARTLFFGYGFRSDPEAAKELRKVLRCTLVSVKLMDRRFYHLDTCFCPLSESHALYFPGAFGREGIALLNEHIHCHEVPEDEAVRFACNSVVLGQNVLVPAGCEKTGELLKSLSFKVFSVDFSEYLKAGGAAKCLTLRV